MKTISNFFLKHVILKIVFLILYKNN